MSSPELSPNAAKVAEDGWSSADPKEASEQARQQKARQRRFITLAAVVVVALLAALAVGLTVPLVARARRHGPSPVQELSGTTNTTDALVSKDRTYVPISATDTTTPSKELLEHEQWMVITTALDTVSSIASTLGNVSIAYPNSVIKMYIGQLPDAAAVSLQQRLFDIAQRMQLTPDYQKNTYTISVNMDAIVHWMVDNVLDDVPLSGVVTGNRRLITYDSSMTLKSVLEAEFNNATSLGPYADVLCGCCLAREQLVALVLDLVEVAKVLVADASTLRTIANGISPHRDDDGPTQQINSLNGSTADAVVVGSVTSYKPGAIVDSDAQITGGGSRHLLQGVDFSYPPASFVPQLPSALPRVKVPVVFHITVYKNANGTFGPWGYDNAPAMIDRLVAVVNKMCAPSKFSFFVQEVRNNPVAQPYLVFASRSAWEACSNKNNFMDTSCPQVIRNSAVSFPRAINIYVASMVPPSEVLGYAFLPGSNTTIMQGHIYMSWDQVNTGQDNSRKQYENGAETMWHEVMHHLGLQHTFGKSQRDNPGCSDDDGISDTPESRGPVYLQSFGDQAQRYCQSVFSSQLGGDWDKVEGRWLKADTIPDEDKNSFADSCPNNPGYDELGNYITYSYPVCYAALGHFTKGQTQVMHQVTYRNNRYLYFWGQYYASQDTQLPSPPSSPHPPPSPPSPPPPSPTPSPPPAPPQRNSSPPPRLSSPAPPPPALTPPTSDPCLVTEHNCKCKDSWVYKKKTFSYCANPDKDPLGTWCAIDTSDPNCKFFRQGWWDYCSSAATNAKCKNRAPPPPPSPPPPPPQPKLTATCTAGASTVSGGTCTSKGWTYGSSPTVYYGCNNPDNDPKGSWCVLAAGTTGPTGLNWDYCQSSCNIGAAPTVAECITAKGSLPPGCQCNTNWGVYFASSKKTYRNNYGCVRFKEAGGQGMCEVECQAPNASSDGVFFYCDPPCTDTIRG